MSINEMETRRYLLKTRVEKAINLSFENVNRKIYILLPKIMEADYISNINIVNEGKIVVIKNGRFIIMSIDRDLFYNKVIKESIIETIIQLTFEEIVKKPINII